MRFAVSVLAVLILGGTCTTSAQSLVELAKQENERRGKLKKKPGQSFNERHLSRVRFGKPAVSEKERASMEKDKKTDGTVPEEREGAGNEEAAGSVVLASFQEEPFPDTVKDVEFLRAGGEEPTSQNGATTTTSNAQFQMPNTLSPDDFYLRGAVYADWFRASLENGLSTSQLSNRLRLEMGRRPGAGWRVFLDARDRFRKGGPGSNQLLVYDANVIYEDQASPIELSVGQMNLYNSVGVGQLLGGLVGYRVDPSWTLGGYVGLQPDIYNGNVDTRYQKYGGYGQYRGAQARTVTLSYNAIRFDGVTERAFVYATGLVPVGDTAVFYGNLQYELGDYLADGDRLSQAFINARYNVTRAVDLSAHYSSGKGLDFHRFLLEQSQDPERNSAEFERFYYSTSYGLRLSVRPHSRVRLYLAQGNSEQKDRMIRNHTTQIGGSALNIARSGVSLYASYNINRGDASESDSYRISLSRDFGPLTWTGYYSSTFNGIRFDEATGLPVIVRMSDRNTFSNDIFFSITRALAMSFQHDHSQGDEDQNTLFFRVIYRL